jgi:hypothetical protein
VEPLGEIGGSVAGPVQPEVLGQPGVQVGLQVRRRFPGTEPVQQRADEAVILFLIFGQIIGDADEVPLIEQVVDEPLVVGAARWAVVVVFAHGRPSLSVGARRCVSRIKRRSVLPLMLPTGSRIRGWSTAR